MQVAVSGLGPDTRVLPDSEFDRISGIQYPAGYQIIKKKIQRN